MKQQAQTRFVRAFLLLGSVAAGGGVYAQTAAVGAEALEEIVITGSRVVSNGNDSPTPVTVVSVQEMEAVRPGTIADQLNDMPQFFGSQGQTSAASAGSANTGNANAQGNVLNLRNFGAVRNLVLFDGHRVAPNSANGTVDIDMIPQMLLQRVDVVTGGASAVYGSDAVTGVVNFVTDTKFQGLKINGQYGRSQENDGDTYAFGLAGGTDLFGGRGHLIGSYEYRGDEGIDARSKREWGRKRYLAHQLTPTTGPVRYYQLNSDTTRQDAAFGGALSPITGQPASPALTATPSLYFSAPGVLSPINPGLPVANRAVPARDGVAGSGSYFDPSLKGELNMHQLFGRLDFDFTDSLHGWVKFSGTDTYNQGYAISNPTFQASNGSNVHAVFITNPYLSAAARNTITNNGAANVTIFGINKVHSGPGMDQYRQNTEAFGRNYAIDTGLSGSFGDAWKWELAFIYGDNEQRVRQNNAVNGRKLAAALDAVPNPNGSGNVCWVTTQAQFAGMYSGCVPYASIFGPTITAAEADWIFDPLEVTTNTKMTDVEGFISGTAFNNWAGPVNVALSAQGRKLSYEVISSTAPATLANPLNCAGLRLITCTPTSLEYFQAESLSRPEISVDVREAAVEFNMPLLSEVFLAYDVSFSGAFRYTDYSTSGGINSWKGGLDWKFTESLSFRGTRSRDIRAPTLHELYQPQSLNNFTGTDQLLGVPLDGNAGRPAPAGNVASGNESVRPELADTVTLGLVYRPEWVPGLSMAIDYYSIKVKDAIGTFNGQDPTTQNACISSGGTSPLCELVVRQIDCCTAPTPANPYANAITRLYTRPMNLARQYTNGVDLELNYSNRLFDMPYNLRLLTSYQPENVSVDPLTGKETNVAGAAAAGAGFPAGHPKVRGALLASISLTDNLKVSVLERYRGRMNWFQKESGPGALTYVVSNAQSTVSPMYLTNLNVAYTLESFGGRTEVYLNIQNLFDRQPAVWANLTSPFPGLSGVAPGDDGVGRYFTLGFRHRM